MTQQPAGARGDTHAFYVVCADCPGPTPKTPFGQQDPSTSGSALAMKGQSQEASDTATSDPRRDAADSAGEMRYTTHFAFASARLSATDKQALASVLPELGQRRLLVAGFTDSIGPEDVNDRLALRRARSVKAYLVERGLNASAIDLSGHGKCCYLRDNDTAAGRAANRRAEIHFTAFSKDPSTRSGDQQP